MRCRCARGFTLPATALKSPIAQTYTLMEDRITGMTAEGELRRARFAFGDPVARLLAVLEFYLAVPAAPIRLTGPEWVANRAKSIV